MYEYKFIEIPIESGFVSKNYNNFDKCREAIDAHAKEGWRLKQVIITPLERSGMVNNYQIILEKKMDDVILNEA